MTFKYFVEQPCYYFFYVHKKLHLFFEGIEG